MEELHRRRQDAVLCGAVAEFRREHPPVFLNGEPTAIFVRSLFSADLEFERFAALSQKTGLLPLCLEFSADRFYSFNREKYRRGKLTFCWSNRTRALRVIDFQCNGKRFDEIPSLDGCSMVEFHHRLLTHFHPKSACHVRDVSDWMSNVGQLPPRYLHLLSLAITDGVLFENFFLTDDEEHRFFEERVWPSFARAIELFGVKPLIVRLFTTEEEITPICWQYPGELYSFACDLLKGGRAKEDGGTQRVRRTQSSGKSIKANFPHRDVHTRLGLSYIHGIGVFAIRDILKGSNIFSDDESEVIWIDKTEVDGIGLDDETKKFYGDFCIIKDGKYGCPVNFNKLTISWYLNEPEKGTEANVYSDRNYVFFAKRDIKRDEELTVDYSTFSEGRGYSR